MSGRMPATGRDRGVDPGGAAAGDPGGAARVDPVRDPIGASRVIRATADGWEGVEPRGYKADDPATAHFRAVTRCALVATGGSERGTEAVGVAAGGAGAPSSGGFELRVFALAAGGYSSLERHAHPHAVMVLDGAGEVILDRRVEPIGPLDVVVVAPWSWHQFHASRGVALRFLCVVDRARDRPQVASAAELAALAAEPALAHLLVPLLPGAQGQAR